MPVATPVAVADHVEQEGRQQLRTQHQRVPHLNDITSLANARLTRGEEGQLIVADLMENLPETEEELALLKKRIIANPLYRDLLVSEDGKLTTIVIKSDAYSTPETEVEDLLQEVALRVVREIHRLRQPEAFRGWCRSIAVNVSRSALRRSKVQRDHLRSLEREVDEQPQRSLEQQGRDELARQDLERVMDLIEGFHPDYREPLLMKSLHGWSQREIAEMIRGPGRANEALDQARAMLAEGAEE